MIAKKLKKGDMVRIIAPSRSLSLLSDETFNIAKKRFEDMGLIVTISKNAYNIDKYNSSSIEDRVNDLHDAFSDENVKLIMCAIGGYNCIELLDKIDYSIIKNNPKIIMGYSDNTALLNAIYKQTGLVTYLGPNFADFGMKYGFDYTLDYFKKNVFENEIIRVEDSKEYSDDKWYLEQNDRTFFKNIGRKVVNYGKAKGKIIAGNLCTLNLLQGTEYMPNLENVILFIEDDDLVKEEFLYEFDRNLHSLMLQPNFQKVKAIVIGRMQINSKVSIEDLVSLLKGKREISKIPILINVDFGHTTPLLTIPIGKTCIINEDKIIF